MTYVIKRVLMMIPIILGITMISFCIMTLAPGSPIDLLVNPNTNAEDLVQIKKNLGLDKPVAVQYGIWLKNLLTGNLGTSYVSGKPVLSEIAQRLPATLLLSITSLIAIFLICIPLGVISAKYQNKWIDTTIMILSFIGLSMPTFWVGLIVILIFAIQLNWLPTSGFMDPLLFDAPIWTQVTDIARHLALPLLTILVGGLASLTRYLRFGMVNELSKDYIKAATARSISDNRILYRHAFKNAALPIVTILGLSLPELIGGSFIIEYIFAWPGMGQLGVTAVFARDYPVIMGILLFSSILILIGNFLADLMYRKIDPRIEKAH